MLGRFVIQEEIHKRLFKLAQDSQQLVRSLTVEKYTGKGRGPKPDPKDTSVHRDPMDEGKSAKYTQSSGQRKRKPSECKIREIKKKIASRKRNDQSCKMLLMGQDE